jgi:signal transduction histidine kinase
MRGMLGREAATPRYLCAPAGSGFWRRMLTPLKDPQSWLDVVWSLVGLVTGTFAFAVALVWWAATLTGLTYWFWQIWIPERPDDEGLAELIGLGSGRTAESLLNLAIGVLMLLTLPFAMRLAAVVHSSLASVLLCSRAELQDQVVRVEGTRDAARLAEAESLRRLERDIHDGPQQRLVRLTMDLGRAKKQVAEDPDRAAETLDDALAQARETVAELRSLSRGIAPPLLVDRGLAAALAEMLSQSVVPVTSRIDVPEQLPPHVETAVYFVVAEALTNVAKHSGARSAEVAVVVDGGVVEVRVRDDGVGGAHPAKGLGLSGLKQRLAAVDGTLEITSPEWGGTTLLARIPL